MRGGPPKTLPNQKLALARIDLSPSFRIYRQSYPDPLECGDSPSRFSPPPSAKGKKRFRVIYLGTSFKVAFVESLLRDQANSRDGTVWLSMKDVEDRLVAEIVSNEALVLVDLRRDGPIKMGVPSDVAGASNHGLSQVWSAAFYAHPSSPDGILYPSRLNEELCVAVYDRAIPKLKVMKTGPVREHPDIPDVLDTYTISLVPKI